MKRKIKAVFIDRDGTINVERNYVHKKEDFELIPGVLDALRLLTINNIRIYIITNQAGIARGFYTEKQFKHLTEYMCKVFKKENIKIDDVLYCPHHPDGIIQKYSINCLCRKPETQLLDKVIAKENFKPYEIVLIGDKDSDIEAGKRLGICTYLVLTGYGMESQKKVKATYIKTDLLSSVKHILEENN